MVAKAFVLMEVQVGRTSGVVDKLRKLEGIKSADPVTGPYDVIAIIEAESMNDIGDLLTTKVHPIAGISRIVTCLVLSK
jgi:DNA-binding Lrp family transcriptional regulator